MSCIIQIDVFTFGYLIVLALAGLFPVLNHHYFRLLHYRSMSSALCFASLLDLAVVAVCLLVVLAMEP